MVERLRTYTAFAEKFASPKPTLGYVESSSFVEPSRALAPSDLIPSGH